MSRSYLLPVIALGLVLANATCAYGQHHDNRSRATANQRAPIPIEYFFPADDSGSYELQRIAHAVEAEVAESQPYEEQDRSERTVKASEKVADWTPAIFVVALLEMFITGLGVALLAKTLGHTARAADAAEKTITVTRAMGRAQTRAYLAIKSATMTRHSFGTSFEIEIANTGQSPAKWVEIEGNAHVIQDKTVMFKDIPLNPSGELKSRWPIDPGGAGRGYPFIANEGNKGIGKLVADAGYQKTLVIQGTVRWETVFEEIYESTFLFGIVPSPMSFKGDEDGDPRPVPQIMPAPSNVNLTTYRRVRDAETDEKY